MVWDAVSAISDVVVALTAVVAAIYALKQYRHSVKLQEVQQMLEMYRNVESLVVRTEADMQHNGLDRPTESHIRSLLNLIVVHERIVSEGLFSSRVEQFYRDVVTISNKVDPSQPFAIAIREVLRANQEEYSALIDVLRSRDNTRPLTEW
ncbi:hypothetical protein G6M04_14425 [Agrobacterium rhizogenes]|uniref:hypothetical protein n=1 Tax=Rhizobium rhizogenes TaxID=359 RepID=UPI0015721310|nr:hypothetical protein [Rhizobium rhizogenes]NTG48585.1 hypothetical protein [Rhizobium rhizogenes]